MGTRNSRAEIINPEVKSLPGLKLINSTSLQDLEPSSHYTCTPLSHRPLNNDDDNLIE